MSERTIEDLKQEKLWLVWGYLAYKFLEGKLIRKNAIKVIQMKTAK